MNVFVFEYVTGGGFADQELPAFLPDGETIWQALVKDVSAIQGVDVTTMRDDRLPRLNIKGVHIVTTNARRYENDYQRCLALSDAVWPVAPEENGILESLNRGVLNAGKRLLGCQPQAVSIATSKLATAQQLAQATVPVVPTFTSPSRMATTGPVVAKPDDGAGCQATYYFQTPTAAAEWCVKHNGKGFVFQPYITGEPLSLSLLCHQRSCELLSINRQHIRMEHGQLHFSGVTVNAISDQDHRYAALAMHVCSAIPGLWGYVGIDLIDTEIGPIVLEVNPRATVSYAGLSAVLGFNLAEKLLQFPDIRPARDFSLSSLDNHSHIPRYTP